MSKIHSNYWLDQGTTDDELLQLLSAKKVVSNFVTILTGEAIPVTYNTSGGSYTDGKTVTIGGNITKPKDFDSVVGLSLHEASHIKLSDFKLLQYLQHHIPAELYIDYNQLGYSNDDTTSLVKDLWNYVEDRRIDRWVYSTAPGYREYYRSMYNKYFTTEEVQIAMESGMYTDETIDSYLFRVINLHTPWSDLSKLDGLVEIYNLIGLGKISRLKTSKDALDVALGIARIIINTLNHKDEVDEAEVDVTPGVNEPIGNVEPGDNSQQTESDSSSGNGSNNNSNNHGTGSDSPGSDEPVDELVNGTPTGNPSGVSGNGTTTKKLSKNMEKRLEKVLQTQRDFLNGEIKKSNISKRDNQAITVLEESKTNTDEVNDIIISGYRIPPVKIIHTRKLTRGLLEQPNFILSVDAKSGMSDGKLRPINKDFIERGIALGTTLGKKLQLRGESRTTVFTRQRSGRIDKRMLSTIPSGNEGLFTTLETSSYKKANLHISIDGSGSMSGRKWNRTIILTTALCKAATMLPNLDVQVTIRATFSGNKTPYLITAYDSTKDKFSHFKEMFTYITPNGFTPEGLLFKTIMDEMKPSGHDIDSYFLNISDGEPYFELDQVPYSGPDSHKHTKQMVDKIRNKGISILSYYVSDYANISEYEKSIFKTMYGDSANFVDVNSLVDITKTMNKLFLRK